MSFSFLRKISDENILSYTLLSEVRRLSVRTLIFKYIRRQFWGYQTGHGTNFFHSSKVRLKLSLCLWMFSDGCEMRLWSHVTTFLVRRERNGSLTFSSGKTKIKISVMSMQMFKFNHKEFSYFMLKWTLYLPLDPREASLDQWVKK